MSKSNHSPVLIVGAGLAGLSLAAILHTNDIPYLVFESSPRTRSQSHGITLYPWAYLPLSKALSIPPEELRSAVATDLALGGLGAVDLTVRNVYTGGILQHMRGTSTPEAFKIVGPFRANKRSMRDFFLKKIDTSKVLWEWKLRSSRISGRSVIAEFENGEIFEGRLLVAADGLQSVARHDLLPIIKPTNIPLTVYSGRRTITRALFDDVFSPHMRDTTVLLGSGDGCAFEININSIDDTNVVISWTYSRDGDSPVDSNLQLSQPHPGIAKTITADLAQLPKLSAPFDQLNSKKELEKDVLYNWMMRSVRIPLESLSAMTARKVVLIGDAAHAIPIYKGTGGNHALLDSIELGDLLCATTRRIGFGLKTESTDTQFALTFYENAHKRWQDAIATTESKLQTMHLPINALRATRSAGFNSKI